MFLFIFVAIPLIVASVMLIIGRFSRDILPDFLANLCFFLLLCASIMISCSWPGTGQYMHILKWFSTNLNIKVVLDGLSLLMIFTISIVSLSVGLFSINYMGKYGSKSLYYAILLVLVASMNGIVLTSDLFTMYIFIEAAGIASYGLVSLGRTRYSTEGAFKYLVLSAIASSFILLGIAGVFVNTGTTDIRSISASGFSSKFFIILFLTGFSFKCGLVPFHTWMPDAYTAAPAVLPAISSGIFVKVAGVYTVARIFFNALPFSAGVSSVMVYLGIISIVVGALLALGQSGLKRLLAYSSISQVGYIILGIGIGTPLGIIGGLLHMFNHAIFKSLLFLNAGAVEYTCGTDDSLKLGGLGKNMPFTSTTNVIGLLSAAGVPPLNGFWSKLIIVVALFKANMFLYGFIAILASVLTLGYLLLIQRRVFFGKIKECFENIVDVPFWMNLSMVGLGLVCVWVGVSFAPILIKWVLPAANVLMQGIRTSFCALGGIL